MDGQKVKGSENESLEESVSVCIRIRPLQGSENDKVWSLVPGTTNEIAGHNDKEKERKAFDHVFDDSADTHEVYQRSAQRIVRSVTHGYNGTIFAYGQTAAGKTYTMQGSEKSPGILRLAVEDILDQISKTEDRAYLIRCSYLEIYNERVRDLLPKDAQQEYPKVRQDKDKNPHVESNEEFISTADEALQVLEQGERRRTVAETGRNEKSSRSHSIFRLVVESHANTDVSESSDKGNSQVLVGELNLVDLAGSENASASENITGGGDRLRESSHINRSLSTLSRVINELPSAKRSGKSVSFRDSKLTYLLQSSLGGNSRIAAICCVSPATSCWKETKSTLNFASSAKKVSLSVKANEVVDDQTKIKHMQNELSRLKKELERAKNGEQSAGATSSSADETNENGEQTTGQTQQQNAQAQAAEYEKLIDILRKQVLVGGAASRNVLETDGRTRAVDEAARMAKKGRQKRHRETWCGTLLPDGTGASSKQPKKQLVVAEDNLAEQSAGYRSSTDSASTVAERSHSCRHSDTSAASTGAENDSEEVNRLKTEVSRLSRTAEVALQEKEEKEQEIENLKKDMGEQKRQNEEQLTRLKDELSDTKAQNEQLQEQLQEIENLKKDKEEQKRQNDEQLTRLRDELSDTKAQNEQMQDQLQNQKKDKEEQKRQNEEQLTRLKDELSGIKAQNEQMQDQVQRQKKDKEEQKQNMEEQLTRLRDELSDTKAQNEQMQDQLQRQIQDLKSKVSRKDAKLSEASRKEEEANKEIDYLKGRVAKLDKAKLTKGQVQRLSQLKKERDSLKSKLPTLEGELKQLKQENSELRSSGSAAASARPTNEESEKIQKEISTQEALENLQVKYHDAVEEKEAVEQELQHTKSMLRSQEENNEVNSNIMVNVVGSLASLMSLSLQSAQEFSFLGSSNELPTVPNVEDLSTHVKHFAKTAGVMDDEDAELTSDILEKLNNGVEFNEEKTIKAALDLLQTMLSTVSQGLRNTLRDRLRIMEVKNSLKEELDELKKSTEQQQKEMSEKMEYLQSDLNECKSSLAQRDADVASKGEEIQQLKETEGQLRENLRELQSDSKQQKQQLENLEYEKSQIEQAKNDVSEKLKYTEEQLSQSREEHRNGVKFLEQENLQLMLEIRSLRQSLSNTEKKLDQSESEQRKVNASASKESSHSGYNSNISSEAGGGQQLNQQISTKDQNTENSGKTTSQRDQNTRSVLSERDANVDEEEEDFGSLKSPGTSKQTEGGRNSQRESLARPRLDLGMQDEDQTGECAQQ